jgi:hypothetical protein
VEGRQEGKQQHVGKDAGKKRPHTQLVGM